MPLPLPNRFFASVITSGDAKPYLKLGRCGFLFTEDAEQAAFQWFDEYVLGFGVPPSMEDAEQATGLDMLPESAPVSYLYDEMFKLYVRRSLVKAVEEADKVLHTNPLAALAVINNMTSVIEVQKLGPKVFDFRNAHEVLWPHLMNKWNNVEGAVKFGIPSLDQQAGGMQPGDLMSLVGRPGLGKTWLLLFTALYNWHQGKPVLFVSNEIRAEIIMERLAAMQFSIPAKLMKLGMGAEQITATKHGMTVSKPKSEFKENLLTLKGSDVPLLIVDANMAGTVKDMRNLARRFEIDLALADGAYLFKHPMARTLLEAVAINANLLKQEIATDLGIPCYASWQFAKEMAKLKVGEKPGLHHIAGSEEIGRASSVAMGLFQKDDHPTFEMIMHRIVSILKGRDGETGEFRVRWDFEKMDFSEITEADLLQMPVLD